MNDAKIQLSPEESGLLMNSRWILTKNEVIRKLGDFLGELSEHFHSSVQGKNFPPELLVQHPKISKGENFRGLPYIVLDYPRYFSKEHLFAIRTMAWWGKYFSITLHLKGIYLQRYKDLLNLNETALTHAGYYCNMDKEEWKHDITGPHFYRLQNENGFIAGTRPGELPVCKIATWYPVDSWMEAGTRLAQSFEFLVNMLAG